MGSGASSASTRAQQREARSQAEERRRGGENRRPTFWCHQCQVSISHLAEGNVCPLCHGGFVQESSSTVMLAQAARWLAGGGHLTSVQAQPSMGARLLGGGGHSSSMEARITRLLDDLHAHLEMVEDLHQSMRHVVHQAEENGGRQRLDPAPQEVLDAIEVMELDADSLQTMRQTPQCVICCADFEADSPDAGRLSRLPGCGHLFHEACVMQWLERSSNCPICRGNLTEVVALNGPSASLQEAVAADAEPKASSRIQLDSSTAASSSSESSTAASSPSEDPAGSGARGSGSDDSLLSATPAAAAAATT